mmetsp:Transcript_95672/g.249161  ORF Transcript_95672/g.249161 Transcript_95672/m.249161 type:complete len:269 (+) Transcript_95672:232-1038(+)
MPSPCHKMRELHREAAAVLKQSVQMLARPGAWRATAEPSAHHSVDSAPQSAEFSTVILLVTTSPAPKTAKQPRRKAPAEARPCAAACAPGSDRPGPSEHIAPYCTSTSAAAVERTWIPARASSSSCLRSALTFLGGARLLSVSRRRSGKKTASGATMTVQSYFLYSPSLSSSLQAPNAPAFWSRSKLRDPSQPKMPTWRSSARLSSCHSLPLPGAAKQNSVVPAAPALGARASTGAAGRRPPTSAQSHPSASLPLQDRRQPAQRPLFR